MIYILQHFESNFWHDYKTFNSIYDLRQEMLYFTWQELKDDKYRIICKFSEEE